MSSPTSTTALPPRGWNSWDCYGTTVTEDEILANARWMSEHLLPYGWDHVVVDIQWYEPTARAHGYNEDPPVVLDAYGNQLPAPNRFPSAVDGAGFGPLAAQVHALGLTFVFWTGDDVGRPSVAASSLPFDLGSVATDLWDGGCVTVDARMLTLDIEAHGVRLLRFGR